ALPALRSDKNEAQDDAGFRIFLNDLADEIGGVAGGLVQRVAADLHLRKDREEVDAVLGGHLDLFQHRRQPLLIRRRGHEEQGSRQPRGADRTRQSVLQDNLSRMGRNRDRLALEEGLLLGLLLPRGLLGGAGRTLLPLARLARFSGFARLSRLAGFPRFSRLL